MKIKIIFLLVALSFIAFAYAQQLDSLLLKIKVAKEDTAKVRLLNKAGNFYKSNNFDAALYYFNASKKLSEKIGFSAGVINYYLNVHGVYLENGKYDSSLLIIRKGLQLAENSGDKMQLAKCYESISSSYHYLIKFDSCSKYDLKAQLIYESLGKSPELMVFYGNLCSSFAERHEFEKSKAYGFKAIKLNEQGYGDDNDLLYALSSLSTTYIYLNQNDSALYFANKTVELCKQEKNYYVQQVTLGNIILIKLNQQDYNGLMPVVNQLKKLEGYFDTPEFSAQLNLNYAIANFYTGKTKLAKEYALSALQVSELNKLSVISKNSYIILDKIETALGNYALSDKYSEKRDSINNEQMNEATAENIQELEKKYETEKKDKEIVKLDAANKQKSTLNKILFGGAGLLLIISLLGYRNFKSRQQIQQQKITELEKDKQLLAIDAMLKGQEEERSRIAKDLHDGLGGMLSGVKLSFVNMKENMVMDAESVSSFENSIMQLDNTIAELRKVAHNLMPEALVKFGLKNAVLDYCNAMQLSSKTKIIFEQLGNERQLSNTADLYIYRIIQELINNAIKHAAPNQILVQLTKTNDKILLTVEDDGKGFDKQILPLAKGIGMKNLQQRVDYFKGKIDITSQPTEGTSVNIELIA
jgi:two-component system, NarL family, sensor kinase